MDYFFDPAMLGVITGSLGMLVMMAGILLGYALAGYVLLKDFFKSPATGEAGIVFEPERNRDRFVVAAANLYSNGVVLIGVRHWDEHMYQQALRYRAQGALPEDDLDPAQGFVDNKGVFLSREHAWIVAEKAGQIWRRVGGDGHCLYSENLY